MPLTTTLDIPDPAAMTAFGRRLADLLFPGAVIALVGPLGAGKTFLTRAIAEGLHIADSRMVSSPTFVLIQEYPAQLPIYHFDAYRLPSPEAFAELGVHEYFTAGGVCLIEWADRVEECLPAEHLVITIRVTGEHSRSIALAGQGERYEQIVAQLAA